MFHLMVILLTAAIASCIWQLIGFTIEIIEGVLLFKTLTIDEITGGNAIRHNIFFTLYYQPLFVLWAFGYYGLKMWLDMLFQKEKAENATLLAREAQLKMLTYQLNPHFLFNSLNSIEVLVDENQEVAKKMISELSEFLRYSLLSSDIRFQPFGKELGMIKKYLSIEKRRYEKNLELNYSIAKEALNFPVLNFLLQPFIENAIKYGMQTSSLPLKVGISAITDGNKLSITISNSGRWVSQGRNGDGGRPLAFGTGKGVNNVCKRLQNAYNENFELQFVRTDQSVEVHITIFNHIENAKDINHRRRATGQVEA